MDFFPDPPAPPQDEPDPQPQPVWSGAPDDVIPGVVPVELVLGRSGTTVVFLTGIRAFPSGLGMTLGVRIRGPGRANRRDLNSEVDPPAWSEQPNQGPHWSSYPGGWEWEPDRPLLTGGGGGGGTRSVDRDYWLWPLPPPGRLRIVCQWPDEGIDQSVIDLDAQPFLDAAGRAQSVWPTG